MNVETVVVLPYQEIIGDDAIQRAEPADRTTWSAVEHTEAA